MKFFSGLKRKRKPIIALLCIIAIFFLADYLIGQRQESIIRERDAKKQQLERLAFFMVFPDVQDAGAVAGVPEEHEAVLKIDALADEPIYATYPEVRAYVQTGTFWTEVPIRDKEKGKHEQIIKLDKGQHLYKKIITIKRDIKYTFYQMFGYMHVRLHISMFVVPQSVFKEEEVIDRANDVYMYLKPYFLSDREILKQVKFPNNKVPTMIPMPPH